MRLTAQQISDVLDRLPMPREVNGKFIRIIVREPSSATPYFGEHTVNEAYRFFEFEKLSIDGPWVLASVPQF